ncbi:hypothetical protein SAMN04487967_1852 [Natronorubrum sediminis]|uniref:Uncharacterized protein n=1 Tax=Natronorubrum sediminis TaxID=640943 RepID=A0A1H6FWZ9_9EURY|nr:hypothetical protein [Natronorubrum sediminis]SEH14962.1 hypothetical protein SAMN04487967_1852 [Natronorubrum sediminis]
MNWKRTLERINNRVFGAIAGVTILLTAAMVGAVALLSGDVTASSDRLQYYVLLTAIAFVTILWRLDEDDADGVTVLIATTGIALGSGILVALSIEGLRYGLSNPDQIVSSQLIVYLLACGLVCTGLGMWCFRHWREFTVYDSA